MCPQKIWLYTRREDIIRSILTTVSKTDDTRSSTNSVLDPSQLSAISRPLPLPASWSHANLTYRNHCKVSLKVIIAANPDQPNHEPELL